MQYKEYSELKESIHTYTHDSGLKIFMVQKPGFYQNAAYFCTHYGSIDNEFALDGKKTAVPDGIAHFLEHKMFEQPDGLSVFEKFSKFGASANAYTSFDMTAYYFTCTEHFETNIKTLIDYVQTPYFTDENVEKEQGIIAQEIMMGHDNPELRCYYNMLGNLYHHHPIARDIAGSVESIREIDKDLLYRCYNTFYHPSNMVLCLVGDFDLQAMKACVDGALKQYDRAPLIERIYPDEPACVVRTLAEEKHAVGMPIYVIGIKDTDLPDGGAAQMKRRIVMGVILDFLFSKSADFYTDMYEQGLIDNSFMFDYSGGKGYGFAEMSGQSKNPQAVFDQIRQTIQNANIKEASLQRIINNQYGSMMMLFNSVDDYADQLARYETFGFDLFAGYDIIRNITMEDVQSVLKRSLNPENMTLSVVKPV